ncbi:MAG: circadian clock protein KaiC [Chitinophagaceae bacterium]
MRFPKAMTGIPGLDLITNGGIPKNRPTLLLGNAGCGKTIMAMEFLVHGMEVYRENAVFLSFEEKTEELETNVRSFGFDLDSHISKGRMYLEYVHFSRDNILKSGKYDIEGLFVRLDNAIKKVKAKRVVLDSLDTLFHGFEHKVLRTEIKRLLTWLKDKQVTTIVTGELGHAFHSTHGVEEYVSDCVILLDNRTINQITTRRLRIVKYRGSIHGNNEYPFIIDEKGITVLPIINEALKQKVSSSRILSGLEELDDMLDRKGFFVGSSVLISGSAGTGKTGLAATFAYAAARRKQNCLFCAFEEAPNQIIRNMKSIGMSLIPLMKTGHLNFYYARPTLQNLELHFIAIKKMILETSPSVVVLDPITNLMTEGPNSDIRSMLTRFVDYLKTKNITVFFTAAITVGSIERNPSDEGISSMVDTWIMVTDVEAEAERTRRLCIIKSRGMKHSHQLRRFAITSKGIRLFPVEKEDAGTATDEGPGQRGRERW